MQCADVTDIRLSVTARHLCDPQGRPCSALLSLGLQRSHAVHPQGHYRWDWGTVR